MCLIIECNKDIPLNKRLLSHIQHRNNDGYGFMWIANNKINIFKTEESDEDLLWEKYKELEEFNPFLHLRFRTHGEIDHANTHPYPCGYGIHLMHNGVMNTYQSKNTEKSDTWHLIEQLIKPFLRLARNPHKAIRSPEFRYMLDHQAGTSNRLVLGDRGGFVVFGEKNWHVINNEKTKAVGLRVSNTYAWDASIFGKNKQHKPGAFINYGKLATHESWTEDDDYLAWEKQIALDFPTVPPPTTQKPSKDITLVQISPGCFIPSNQIVYWQGHEYFQVMGNIYERDDGGKYFNNGRGMVARPDLEKKVEPKPLVLIKEEKPVVQQNLLALLFKEAEEELVNDAHEEELAADKEVQRIISHWVHLKEKEVITMAYTDPDEAAVVINYLMKNRYNHVQ